MVFSTKESTKNVSIYVKTYFGLLKNSSTNRMIMKRQNYFFNPGYGLSFRNSYDIDNLNWNSRKTSFFKLNKFAYLILMNFSLESVNKTGNRPL